MHIKELMRVLFAIFRYPAAIVVAFVASIMTTLYLPHYWDFVSFFFTGLTGVAAGSFCLPRSQQWIGSLCLLFLGLGFAFYFFYMFSEGDSGGAFLLPLVPLAVGGIIPGAVHYLFRKSRLIKTPQ